MGFSIEPGDAWIGDVAVTTNYDGPGQDRVVMRSRLDALRRL